VNYHRGGQMNKFNKYEIKEYEVIEDEEINPKNIMKNNTIYIGYFPRVFINLILLILFFSLGLTFLLSAFTFKPENNINISESSNINYKVYLKDNLFYDDEYLEEGMSYVSSLIKNISVDFNYLFKADEKLDLKFNYNIVAKLQIKDINTNQSFYEKDYILLDTESEEIKDSTKYTLKKNVNIDYDYYNELANNFKSSYGVSTESNLIVTCTINQETDNSQIRSNNTPSLITLTIPLSEKSVNIALQEQEINNKSNILETKSIKITNKDNLLISIVLILISVYLFYKLLKLISNLFIKKTRYDKYISKILKEYDRLIVETTSMPKKDDLIIFKINKFTELLDVRDNLKLPIMYYNVTSHNKCHFYIKNNNELYIHTVKAIDLEKNDEI
jgi:hypothetical protein